MQSVPISVAARLLDVNAQTVRRMIRAGKLHAWRTPGGHRRLNLSDVIEARRSLEHPEAELVGAGVEAAV